MKANATLIRASLSGATNPERRLADWLPLVVLPVFAFSLRDLLPAWIFMWTLAFAIFSGCKWLTWRSCEAATLQPWRNWAYCFAWPGLGAKNFLHGRVKTNPAAGLWVAAWLKTFLGATLLWGVARTLPAASPLLIGWCGLLGIIFLLHFGMFHLIALAWQRVGVNALPIMRAPIGSTSLAEFWGKRWNTAFHELAFRFVFAPVRRLTNSVTATLTVFIISGLIHDLVISVPARGGYGLPTAYFVVQGLGTIGEQTELGRRLGLGRGIRGWIFTVLVTAGPVFWLFHPAFIRNVILPMLHAIGAT